jgi:hypothetical protein
MAHPAGESDLDTPRLTFDRRRKLEFHGSIVAQKCGVLTLIHARQNKRVSEEAFSAMWKKKLTYAFQI